VSGATTPQLDADERLELPAEVGQGDRQPGSGVAGLDARPEDGESGLERRVLRAFAFAGGDVRRQLQDGGKAAEHAEQLHARGG